MGPLCGRPLPDEMTTACQASAPGVARPGSRTSGIMSGMAATRLMTSGVLARRAGMSVKAVRAYADAGLIYSTGRSAAGYRLFADEALWCVGVIRGLRALGLTVAEIKLLGDDGGPVGPQLARLLATAKRRTADRVGELQQLLARIAQFEAAHRGELSGEVEFDTGDPRAATARP